MPKKPPSSTPRGKRITFFVVMLFVAGLVACGLAELALRLFPVPGIIFHNYYYDEVTGGKYYPNSTVMFRGDDGVLVRRNVNSWGFLDVQHELAKPTGTLRIAFFGDSYVEALQVPIEQTFFRLIENDLDLRTNEFGNIRTREGKTVNSVETLAFGISGRGALQEYLECQQWMEPADLDYVVYVFVENDPANLVPEFSGDGTMPFPVATADSFTIDNSAVEQRSYKASWWHRTMQRIKSNSLVVSTIEGRLKLLKTYGAKRKVTEADRAGVDTVGVAPMAPSSWPPDMVPKGWELQVRVMDKWRKDVEAQGRTFVVMHVPRGNEVLRTPLAEQDTWATRLHAYCKDRGIPLVDPTPLFAKRMDAGETMYHHHFTPEGHRAFAESFVNYLLEAKGAR